MLYNLINFLGKMSKFQTSEVVEKAKKKTLIAKYIHHLKNPELNDIEKEKAFLAIIEIKDLDKNVLEDMLSIYSMKDEWRDVVLDIYHEKSKMTE
ncbi:MAG: hypothetical protein WC011_00505 [Candidatus Paceibacterota bacterium]